MPKFKLLSILNFSYTPHALHADLVTRSLTANMAEPKWWLAMAFAGSENFFNGQMHCTCQRRTILMMHSCIFSCYERLSEAFGQYQMQTRHILLDCQQSLICSKFRSYWHPRNYQPADLPLAYHVRSTEFRAKESEQSITCRMQTADWYKMRNDTNFRLLTYSNVMQLPFRDQRKQLLVFIYLIC